LNAIERFKEEYPHIKIKIEDWLAIFNYGLDVNFNDPIVQEARGIIIDISNLNVVCWPFRKFGKYDEYYADDIDWSSAVAQLKVDGSIVKLWYDHFSEKWIWSSNSCIYAEQAIMSDDSNLSLMDIINATTDIRDMEFLGGYENFLSDLDKDSTYIFEVISPFNNVVIKYSASRLIHLGTRNNITGEERNDNIGLDKVETFDQLKSLEDCIEFVTDGMNHRDSYGMIDDVSCEGLVVVDANYHRIKVKTPEYMLLHSIVEITDKSKLYLIEMLKNKTFNVTLISLKFPEVSHLLKWYDYQLSNFIHNAKSIIDISRKLYKKYGGDRKSVALLIKDDPYSALGFLAINNPIETPDDIIWKEFGINKVMKYIPDYERINRKYMFEQQVVEEEE
jgi:hypothetical protein